MTSENCFKIFGIAGIATPKATFHSIFINKFPQNFEKSAQIFFLRGIVEATKTTFLALLPPKTRKLTPNFCQNLFLWKCPQISEIWRGHAKRFPMGDWGQPPSISDNR